IMKLKKGLNGIMNGHRRFLKLKLIQDGFQDV
ncbi:hypothetical protein TVAGG3_0998350, partial [Trichomonas vaginalis G3]